MPQRNQKGRSNTRLDLAAASMASSETARLMNRDVVLELIRTHQPVSRAELSRLSGLQRSTVSLIAEQLIRERWVCEGEVAHLPRGRRPTLLGLNDDMALLVADIHPRQATLAVVDLHGRFLARRCVRFHGRPAAAIRQIAHELLAMRESLPHISFEGVGISVPGRVDPQTQQLIFAPNLRWEGERIKEIVEEVTGLTAELENAANAALLAELWIGHLEGVRDAVLVDISEGIGTGLLANGQLVTGQRGMAGEFGHVRLADDGPPCGCGQLGCWETFASTEAALRCYRENTHEDSAAAAISFAELLQLDRAGDPAARAAVETQAKAIGRGLCGVNAGLSPEVIIVAGDITGVWPRYEPFLREELAALSLGKARMPKLAVTDDCETTRLHGAAAIVLQRNSLFRSHG